MAISIAANGATWQQTPGIRHGIALGILRNMTEITRDELVKAIKNLRFWLRPESVTGVAFRGFILHPEDAVDDIITGIEHNR